MTQTNETELSKCDLCNKPILTVEVSQAVADDPSLTAQSSIQSKPAPGNTTTQPSTKTKKRKQSEPKTTNRNTKKGKTEPSRRPNRNGYTEFAADYYRGNMASQVIGTNLRERAQFIAAEWKKLSNEEKEVYKQQAKLKSAETNPSNQ